MTTVGNLHFPSRPAAIPRGIGTIVVDAVEGELGTRTPAHVSKKVGVVIPARIDRYAATAVVFVGFAFRIFASLAQSIPRFVFRRHGMANGIAMLDGVIHSETSAGFSNSSFHVAGEDNGYFPAVTLTAESSKVAFDIEERKDKELSEALTGKINTFGHVA